MKIGNLEVKGRVFLAPMAGVTDLPYRLICEEYGISMVTTEMVSAKAILYKNRNTVELMETSPYEPPVAVQLFGSDPEIMADIAHQIEDKFAAIDVNMGCPVQKIVGNGEGSALMKDPDLAYRILSSMVKATHHPVTVKFRKGFTEDSANAAEFARMAESAGVSMITVHGRTRDQFYTGHADWECIRKVKEAVGIPVIGNGDIFTPQDAKQMIDETGVDGVALARGVKGNPWLIKRTVHYLETGELLPGPELREVKDTIKHHADLMVKYKGEYTAVREMRKHISWYTQGLPSSGKLRDKVNHTESMEELMLLVDKIRM